MRATFTKQVPGAPPDVYATEAAGLRWLADAGPDAAPVVAVMAEHDDRLVLERLTPARPDRAQAEGFGRALVGTHRAGAAAFGAPPPGRPAEGWIGRQRMTSRPTASWGVFYAEQRLLPYARAARDAGHLSPRGAALVDRVVARLTSGDLDDDTSPARLHGDLWSGNLMWTADGGVLLDPAAHGGHPLTDLAMLALFGAPRLEDVLAGYAVEAGLPDGWADLLDLHQLHPLLVHAVSHGPGYGDAAERVAARYA